MMETITYNGLVEWYGVNKAHMSKMRTSSTDTAIQEPKVPIFQVHKCVGNILKGDLYERKVTNVFGNNAMAGF